ncbi:hypothetical protein GCM10010448_32060 [Streptomyces glomeratus]|uniref:Uncharacterized protein n=1 Tax=Streptomyces glomeratus TaxID=284452 RepID=A0ABP6LKW1_9ACTN
MEWWAACLWGLTGSSAVEALDLYRAIQRVKGYPWRMPDEIPLGPYLVAIIIRNALGAGLAAGFGSSGQIAGPLGAIAVGIAAPKIVEQLLRQGMAHPNVHSVPSRIPNAGSMPPSASAVAEPTSSAALVERQEPAVEGEAGVI